MHVRDDSVVAQERHPGVVEAVVPDEVPTLGHPAREDGLGLHPAALQEPGRANPAVREHVEEPGRHPRPMRTVRMLAVEGERHAEGIAHLSTPVMTTPRVNTRWKIRNRTTGMSIVISVPACT